MTKKQIITMLVNDQVARGIIKECRAARQIAWRMRTMSKRECEEWLASASKRGLAY